jgi:hypothetical protein
MRLYYELILDSADRGADSPRTATFLTSIGAAPLASRRPRCSLEITASPTSSDRSSPGYDQ